MSHHRETVTAVGAPAAVGPYSHAVVSNGLLFCSGQVALHPDTGEIVGDTAGAQASQCLQNLEAVCASAGAVLSDAVRCTVWLTSMADFAEVNEVYGGFFGADPPARVCIAVSELPKAARVEIDAVVAMPD
jgi:2-iminobutanoate/2-iminopropanoate deaminase